MEYTEFGKALKKILIETYKKETLSENKNKIIKNI